MEKEREFLTSTASCIGGLPPEAMYKTGEFSVMSGLSKETLRYYAEVGLLAPVYTDPSNQYRYYDNGSFLMARVLVQLRKFNFTIQEMLTVVKRESLIDLEQIVLAKRQAIVDKIAVLQETVSEIDEFIKMGNTEDYEDDEMV